MGRYCIDILSIFCRLIFCQNFVDILSIFYQYHVYILLLFCRYFQYSVDDRYCRYCQHCWYQCTILSILLIPMYFLDFKKKILSIFCQYCWHFFYIGLKLHQLLCLYCANIVSLTISTISHTISTQYEYQKYRISDPEPQMIFYLYTSLPRSLLPHKVMIDGMALSQSCLRLAIHHFTAGGLMS